MVRSNGKLRDALTPGRGNDRFGGARKPLNAVLIRLVRFRVAAERVWLTELELSPLVHSLHIGCDGFAAIRV